MKYSLWYLHYVIEKFQRKSLPSWQKCSQSWPTEASEQLPSSFLLQWTPDCIWYPRLHMIVFIYSYWVSPHWRLWGFSKASVSHFTAGLIDCQAIDATFSLAHQAALNPRDPPWASLSSLIELRRHWVKTDEAWLLLPELPSDLTRLLQHVFCGSRRGNS